MRHQIKDSANIPAAEVCGKAIEIKTVEDFVKDVIEHEEVESELLKMSRALAQSPVSIIITNRAGNIEYVNSAFTKTTGYTQKEAMGKNPQILQSGKTAPEHYERLWKAIATGYEWRGEFLNKAKDGRLFWESCVISPIVNKAGQVTHFLEINEDITQKKQLEEQLRQAQKMETVGQLAAGVAHDFNNLLTVICSYAELIRNDPQTDSQKRGFADTVFQTARRGAALSAQLLTYSRKGTDGNKKIPLQVNNLIADLHKMLQRVLPGNITVRTCLADDLGQVNVSAEQLHQVLMNLAVNAAHAMPDGGVLTIETRHARPDPDHGRFHPEIPSGDFILIVLSDTGHGMDKQTMQHIYEPFFTTKKAGEGTGLGLSVVYRIVQEHGGNILCRSEVGVGTTFDIYLPALQSTGKAASLLAEVKPDLRGGNETILIVDDEVHIRNLVRDALTTMGYTVISAGDGESALLRHREEGSRICLVLLDLDLPGMGGWKCLKRLRAMDSSLPVVIFTGYMGENLRERARQEGAAGLICKPYEMETLFLRVRQILDEYPPSVPSSRGVDARRTVYRRPNWTRKCLKPTSSTLKRLNW
jgi:two-component system, cell cycle sensor histidine kinase and response regulator CckA